jgi:methionine sulfoxide reductase catalytic subunit
LNRRRFLGAGSAALVALTGLRAARAGSKLTAIKSPFSTSEQPTSFEAITHYNNFYEFGTDKEDPFKNASPIAHFPMDGED